MSDKSKKQIRLGLIGVGAMGSTHAERLRQGGAPSVKLAALCDHHKDTASRFPEIPFYSDVETMLEKADLDAVFIATPHYQHTEIGELALRKGFHTLVEKPMSANKADCERLLSAQKESGKKLSVMLSMRTKPINLKIKELIATNQLGKIRRVHWTATNWFRTQGYYASSKWRGTWKGEGGGVLLNQCPHQLDLLAWFFGMPERVTGFCHFGRYHDIETEDDVTAVLHYPEGVKAVFVASTGEAPGTDRLEIVGELGKLVAENGQLAFHRNVEGMTAFSRKAESQMSQPECWQIQIPLKTQVMSGHLEIFENFAEAILHNKPLIAPAEEGVWSVELANAMQYSTWVDATVSLPLNPGNFNDELEKTCLSTTAEHTFSR